MTPTQRTLAECRKRGWLAEVVERWVPHYGTDEEGKKRGGVRKDLFGFVDVVVIADGRLLFIQATSGTNVTHRKEKILTECKDNLAAVLNCGVRVEIWGWRKLKKPVERKYWQVRVEEITQPAPRIGNAAEAIHALREAGLKAWDDVADPEALMKELRG